MTNEQPLFDSIDEMCDAYGWDEFTRARVYRDMELTRFGRTGSHAPTVGVIIPFPAKSAAKE